MFWLAAALSGFLLSAADHPIGAWPLGIVALVPMLLVLGAGTSLPAAWPRARRVALGAVVFSLAYALPLSFALRFPPTLAVGQVLVVTGVWTVAWLGVARALRAGPVAGPLAAAAFVALVEWANFTFIPIWGTAQCFVRTWSAWPPAVQSAAFWGMSGLVFQVVAVQALLVSAWRHRSRVRPLLAAAVLLLPVALGARAVELERQQPAAAGMTVAAVGWVLPPGSQPASVVLDTLIVPHVAEAAARGAELVVTPEVGLGLDAGNRQEILGRLSELARQHQVRLAIGYFDGAARQNRIAYFSPSGRAGPEYAKTHLVPFVESYRAGDGRPVLFEEPRTGPSIGGMICQDDNFVDVAAAYGRAGVGIVAVPTNDWREVAPYHLENSLFRAVENDYGIVRAAANGTSAIVSPRGRVLARMDHFAEGPGVIVARLPRPGLGVAVHADITWLVPFLWLAILAAVALVPSSRRRAPG